MYFDVPRVWILVINCVHHGIEATIDFVGFLTIGWIFVLEGRESGHRESRDLVQTFAIDIWSEREQNKMVLSDLFTKFQCHRLSHDFHVTHSHRSRLNFESSHSHKHIPAQSTYMSTYGSRCLCFHFIVKNEK